MHFKLSFPLKEVKSKTSSKITNLDFKMLPDIIIVVKMDAL